MAVVPELGQQAVAYPAGVTVGSEKNAPLIVVNTGHGKAAVSKPACDFGPDQTAGPSYKYTTIYTQLRLHAVQTGCYSLAHAPPACQDGVTRHFIWDANGRRTCRYAQ